MLDVLYLESISYTCFFLPNSSEIMIFLFYRGSYAGIYSSGFRDFLLKQKILLALQDAAFEHPSEGNSSLHTRYTSYVMMFTR